jgi:hypothetical protein
MVDLHLKIARVVRALLLGGRTLAAGTLMVCIGTSVVRSQDSGRSATNPSPPSTGAAVWRLGKPIVTYFNSAIGTIPGGYWPPGTDPTTLTEAIAKQAVAAGFNTVWINDPAQLAIAEHYGLRAQIVISGHQPQNGWFFVPQPHWPDGATASSIDAWIERFKSSPAAYSYFVIDEPPATRFGQLADIVAYLRKHDPAHLAYINLWPPDSPPSSGIAAKDYATYLSQFIDALHPALLSYDSYNFMKGADRKSYLGNLLTMAQAAKLAGVPFMPIVQGSAWDTNWRLPNRDELRFLSNSALAFGAQGISYFNYWTPYGPSTGGIAPFPDGTETTVSVALRSLNPRFERVATQLQKVHWLGTYIKGYAASGIPRMMLPLPGNPAFDIPGLGNTMSYVADSPLKGVLLGYFGVRGTTASNAEFVFVQNLDHTAAAAFRVSGQGPLSVFNDTTGVWTTTGHPYADLRLEPGGGALMALTALIN